MNIAKVAPDQLKDSKLQDILIFAKNGKVEMVHALIQHFKLELGVMNLKSEDEQFNFKGKQVSIKGWNPLLVAIANK